MAKRLRCGPVIYARYGGGWGGRQPAVGSEASSSPPPCGEGSGVGVSRHSACGHPPLPDPPPQGGREQESALASPSPYFANRYAPPFSTLRWNAGRACMRDSHALRFGWGASLSNTFAISPTKLI